ncbi:MAG: Gfo/Idh/MocA family oxidoreductase [Spirochaetaceae bacterium]|nr:Gfo/Idh/MocA family oxidoreductase [Spirochaetaceae bacterium]
MSILQSHSALRARAPLDVVVVGAGMFTRDVILPSLYHLQRSGEVGSISLAATSTARLAPLTSDEELAEAFPGQGFTAYPCLGDAGRDPRAYLRALDALAPQQLVFVAVPDHLHHEIILDALQRDQHVYSVKPLVQRYEQGRQIGELAAERGLFVGIDYHKRFDRRSLVARRQYGRGDFGEFAYGEARLFEPYFYRHSNFQNWFTCDNSDPFTYVGCHYVDLVYFITGLRPVAVSAAGATGTFPNGNTGYLWAHGRVHWENGAILSVSAGLGYPDAGAGSNDQGMTLYCEGDGRTGLIDHDDQDRGVEYAYVAATGPGGSRFNFVSPDFFRLAPREGAGADAIGYGYESMAAAVQAARALRELAPGERRVRLQEIDRNGLIATPLNSGINELVVEAARQSLAVSGATVRIRYDKTPRIHGSLLN